MQLYIPSFKNFNFENFKTVFIQIINEKYLYGTCFIKSLALISQYKINIT